MENLSWGMSTRRVGSRKLTTNRMFWMMIVARGIAGFGAGGEYPVCATSATEAADETAQLRKRRGFLVATTTDFAVDLVCTGRD